MRKDIHLCGVTGVEEFLTTRAVTSWRKLISIIDSEGEHCKYADSIRNFAEPVTGNLGEIPIIPLLFNLS